MRSTKTIRQPANIAANIGIVLGLILATIGLSELLRWMGTDSNNLILIYILPVLLIAWITPTYFYGLAGAVLSTLACDYFVVYPRMQFSFTVQSPVALLTMFALTIFTSTLTTQMRTQTQVAIESKKRAQLLYEINQELLLAKDQDAILQLTSDYLVSHLHYPVIIYTASPLASAGSTSPPHAPARQVGDKNALAVFHSKDEYRRVHNVFKHGEAEKQRPESDIVYETQYIPLISKDKTRGVIGIACRQEQLSDNDQTFLQILAGQVALALELQYLADEQRRIVVDAEKENMRSTFLRAISHDLRTPLTSILGASSTMLEQQMLADDPTGEKLVRDIHNNAQWLIRMVENLLAVTRISGVKLNKKLEAAEEVVADAVKIVRPRFPDHLIHVHAPRELLMVPMDATLISQVIINLLENAAENSPKESLILLNVTRDSTHAQFSVSDNGNGIPEHLLDSLFQVKPRQPAATDAASREMGLGLSICTAIVKAHGGSIEGYNRDSGGAVFLFRIPLEEHSSAKEVPAR